jgi:hypothetical protein
LSASGDSKGQQSLFGLESPKLDEKNWLGLLLQASRVLMDMAELFRLLVHTLAGFAVSTRWFSLAHGLLNGGKKLTTACGYKGSSNPPLQPTGSSSQFLPTHPH